MASKTEWEFTADVASWINQLLDRDVELPFQRAKCEQRSRGSQKRRDLTILGDDKQPVLTGERGLVRLPHEAEECRHVLQEYKQFVEGRNRDLRKLVEARTADEEMQRKVLDALHSRVNQRPSS